MWTLHIINSDESIQYSVKWHRQEEHCFMKMLFNLKEEGSPARLSSNPFNIDNTVECDKR